MKFLLVFAAFCVLIQQSYCATCAECAATFDGSAKDCTPFKTYMTCLATATACPLAAGKSGELSAAYGALSTDCKTSLTATCNCQYAYWKTDLSSANAADKCLADKTFLSCMKGQTTLSCGITAPHTLASAHTVTCTAEELTDTCTCEMDLARSDATTKKCETYKTFLSCLKTTTGVSCVGGKSAKTVADEGLTILNAIDPCDKTPTCVCETAYATQDITDPVTKCSASKALVECLRSETQTGCVALTTVASLVTLAATTIDLQTCEKSEVCTCEMVYTKGEKIDATQHCSNAQILFACLYNLAPSVTTCNGGTKASLQTFAKNLITNDIANCILSDTCLCQEMMTSGSCADLKTGYNCLETATNTGCDRTKTKTTIAGETATALLALTSPAVCIADTSACKCELGYATADTSNADKTCTAHKAFVTCMKGKTEVCCDGTTPAKDAAIFSAILEACIPAVTTTDACSCEKQYAQADIVADKCTADKVFLMCMKDKTTPACDGTAANVVAGAHSVDADCSAAFTDTCKCEVEFAKSDKSSNPKKCLAYKAFLSCMKTTTGTSCVGSLTAQAVAQAADEVLQNIPTDECEITPTCTGEITYAKEDITIPATKCSANKVLIESLRSETQPGCVTSTTVASLVDLAVVPVENCELTSVCLCEKNYTKGEKTDVTQHCSNAQTLFGCLYNLDISVMTCNGDTKASLQTFAKNLITSSITGCSLSDTCLCQEQMTSGLCGDLTTGYTCLAAATAMFGCDGTATTATVVAETASAMLALTGPDCIAATSACRCELEYAKADTSDAEKKCTADKQFFNCMKGKTEPSCGGIAVHTYAAQHTYVSTCPSSTCGCVIAHLKKDLTTDKCAADKAFIHCMKGKTETSCDGTTAAKDEAKYPTILESCIPAATTTDACSCEKIYAEADIVAGKCTADKEFLMCLKGKTTPSCDGTAAYSVARNHVVDPACSNGFTDTCKCEVDLAKSEMTPNANKCTSYKTFLSCMKTATGASCDSTLTAYVVARAAELVLDDIPGSDCTISSTCACEIAYAKNDITDATVKCDANKALVKCLLNETAAGCVPATTVASLIDIAAADVPNCAKTSVCICKMNYTKGEKTTPEGHCSNAKTLLGCLYNEADSVTTCTGGSKTDLQAFAKKLITTDIAGCSLSDTCACEELMTGGTCLDLKKGIGCLRKATSRGCDGVKIVKTVAEETTRKIDAVTNPVCQLTAACICEVNYTSADVSTDAKRCAAARTMKSCLSTARSKANGVDLKGCDDVTLTSAIDTEMDTTIAKCGAMQSCIVSMTLVLLAALIAHLTKN